MLLKIAKFISTIGHPLLMVPMVVLFLTFRFETKENAFIVSGFVILGLIIPIIIKLLRNLKSGKISNFDVSNQTERNGFYRFVIPLLCFITFVMFWFDQNSYIVLCLTLACFMLINLRIVNRWIKASIHVSVNLYLAYLLFQFEPKLTFIYLFFIGLIAWSRLEMKRHTWKEIIYGVLIGNFWGIIFNVIYLYFILN